MAQYNKTRVTSRDVAKAAGVSQSTVSRALNPDSTLDDELRRAVIRAAAELNYRPNLIARSLVSSKTYILAVIVFNPETTYANRIVRYITNSAQEAGYQVLLFHVTPSKTVDDLLNRLIQYTVDGVFVVGSTITLAQAEECVKNGTRVVIFNRYIPNASAAFYCGDDRAMAASIAEHLVKMGGRGFGVVTKPSDRQNMIARRDGFLDRLTELGHTGEVILVANDTLAGEADNLRRYFTGDAPVDAVFCLNDTQAVALHDVLHFQFGLSVPQDVLLVGYGNYPESALPPYALTTVATPEKAMAAQAVADFVAGAKAGGGTSYLHKIFSGELVVRSSSLRGV